MSELTFLLQKATSHRDAGEFGSAITLLTDRLNEFSTEAEFLKLLAHCYILNEDKESASVYLEKANDAYFNMGVAFTAKEELEAGIECFKQAIKIKPDDVEAYNNLGVVFTRKGELDAAIKNYKQAIEIQPDYAAAYNNLGEVFKIRGDLDAAINSFKQAIKIQPGYAAAYNNLGVAYTEIRELDAGIKNYKKSLTINPDDFDAHFNMGIAFADKRELEAAIESYKQAIKIRPGHAAAHRNMGDILQAKGDLDAALMSYKHAIKVNPEAADAYYNLGYSLESISFNKADPEFLRIFSNLLEKETFVRPSGIVYSIISLLKFEPLLKEALSGNLEDKLELTLQKTLIDLANVPVLAKLMSLCPVPDVDLESLFVKVRSLVLLKMSEIKCTREVTQFLSALALQCFINEYIYNEEDKEINALIELEIKIKEKLMKKVQPSPLEILVLATYKPLHEYSWIDLLLVSDELTSVVESQVSEVIKEENIRSSIPTFQGVVDEISKEVRQQYEDNPYPRWKNTRLESKPFFIKRMVKSLNLRISESDIIDCEAPEILIAGCGTGQHSIQTASSFKNSNVLAVDLSLNSLAYAKRRTQELGISNIEYMQADILNLDQLNRKFDVIESSGVLHHMNDPMAGWKVLTECLKPGGLMKIALYSQLARRDIVEMRREIKDLNIYPNAIEMKAFRQKLLNSEQVRHNKLLSIRDFYSLSEFRDLLFHTQEHRFTILEIQESLEGLGLVFCGLQDEPLIKAFKSVNTESDALYDLKKWHEFEGNNPDAFISMYEFWYQKVI